MAARKGPTGWVALASIALAVIAGVLIDQRGLALPGLADPLNLSLTATTYLAPLAAGAATSSASMLRRTQIDVVVRASPRGEGAGAQVVFWSVFLGQVTAYVLLCLLLLVTADLSGPWTPAMAMLPATAVTVLAVATSAGVWVGSRTTSALAAPSVALLALVWMFAVQLLPMPYRLGAPVFGEVFYQNFLEPNARLLTIVVGIGAGTGLAVMSSFARRRGVVGAAAAGCMLVAVALVPGARPELVQLRAPVPPTCALKGGVTLCVWPESSDSAELALEQLVAVRRSVTPELSTPTTFREAGLPERYGEVVQLPRSAGDDALFLAALAMTPRSSCSSADSVGLRAAGELNGWILQRSRPGTVSDPAIVAITDAPRRQQQRWVEQRLGRLGECRSS